MAVTLAMAMTITMYGYGCDCKPGNPTKSGIMPVAGHTVAADPDVLPIGSIIYIEGLGQYQVHDIGSKVRGRHVDVFSDSCHAARQWGKRTRRVTVIHKPRRTR